MFVVPVIESFIFLTGWAMQSACLIFIKRKWEEDKIYMTKLLNYFAAIKHKTQVNVSKPLRFVGLQHAKYNLPELQECDIWL